MPVGCDMVLREGGRARRRWPVPVPVPVRPWGLWRFRGRGRPCLEAIASGRDHPDAAERGLPYGRASMTMLNGVSAALRTLRKPPCLMASETRANPACAPRAAPTGWSSEVGTQTMVEAA